MSPKRRRKRRPADSTSGFTAGFSEVETKVSVGQDDSPAARYAKAKKRRLSANLHEFQLLFDFPLDDFQLEACRCIDKHSDVLVSAPTSAGKTIIGFYGVFLALQQGKRLFYTTPIKALSNQKFLELKELFGKENVGLLTGDNAVNGEATIIVMTTEVLRNMIFAGADLTDLGFVVMDEVHYLSDQFRGPVWEEIIIHLDTRVLLISLSATISNATVFANWLGSLERETTVISATRRPVPLEHFMLSAEGEIMPLFSKGGQSNHLNRALLAHSAQLGSSRRTRFSSRRYADRPRIAKVLEQHGLLPAIDFVFSRQGCDEAALQVYESGIKLCTKEDSKEIRLAVETVLAGLNPSDLSAIDLLNWEETLASGVAAHHAGLLPVQKQLVEMLFAKGLIRMVFATETLALGINMPARTVVLESLTKWNGQERANLTPGEYTQLTGRAGRRGIDTQGYTVTLLQTRNPPHLLSSLATQHSYPLHSAFAPNYNMAVNLLARTTLDGAKETVEKSFAQYEALGSSAKLLKQLNKFASTADRQASAAQCEKGDIFELLELMQLLSHRERQSAQRRHQGNNTLENRAVDQETIGRLRQEMKSHPCYSCAQRETHLGHARSSRKASASASALRRRVEIRTKSLAHQLDRICALLRELGYLTESNRLTSSGQMLKYIYSERDLLISECLNRGIFSGLDTSDLAGLLSVLVTENRSGGLTRLIPCESTAQLASALESSARINFEISTLQRQHDLDAYPPLDTNMAVAVTQWARGSLLGQCLELSQTSGGDFVRVVRQVIDLADQLRKVVPEATMSEQFRGVVHKIKRGVVAWDF